MKRKLLLLLSIMLVLSITGSIIIKVITQQTSIEAIEGEEKLKIVTTFYPVYMIGLNIANQVEGIEVKSLTDLNTGCLHDYQLTTEDMKIISSADIMIINGGGMEGFLEDIAVNYPDLTIIDASEGIAMLPSELEEEHEDIIVSDSDHEEEDHAHGEWNAHVWLDPLLYIRQIENVKDGLLAFLDASESSDTILTEAINTNVQEYIVKITELNSDIDELANSITEVNATEIIPDQAVIFHDAFAYLANRIGITVSHTVPLDSDTSLSAGDIAEIIKEVKEENIRYLFTEEQYSDSIAKRIEAETEATVTIIDSAVTGNGSEDSYLVSMRNNLKVLKEAIK